MQIFRITTRHRRRYQKTKKDLQLIDTRHSNLYPKYIHVQLGPMDLDTNPGKQHRFISKESAKKNHQSQMAKDDLQ